MSASWTRLVLVGLGLLAVGVPGVAGQVLGGVPLGWAGFLAATLVMYAGLALPKLQWPAARWLVLGLALGVGLKIVGAASAPPFGLQASYWAKASADGAPERSTDFPQPWLREATRIDASLNLRGEAFPVYFFNDAARFNFGPDVQPGRDQLPFTVRWVGFLDVPSDGERAFAVQANGVARLWLDDRELPLDAPRTTLSGGLHPLRVEYTRPEAKVPRLEVSWQRTPGGALEPLGGADLRWAANATSADLSRGLGLVVDLVLAASILAWMGLGLSAARTQHAAIKAALGAVPLVFLAHGLLLHAPLIGHATILSGLDDWLIYESSARDILLNGLLMDGGQGHAAPFYGQPFYPYVLAVAHRLTGESLFGPLALQFAAVGLVLVGGAVLARRAFGQWLHGLAALACLWLLLQLEPEHFKVARQLFNENLYMPLVMASLIGMVTVALRVRPLGVLPALGLGVLFGLTAISRSQFLLFVPFGLLILLQAWRRSLPIAVVSLAAVVLGLLVTVAPVTARNLIVSGQFVPISSSGGASLLEFHRPPPGLVDQTALSADPVFEALHLDAQTRTVLAFLKADPRGYLATLVPLGAHSVGLQGRNDPGVYWPLLITSALYLASFALKRTRRLHVWPIHAFVATHLLVLMLFEADTYGYRLVVPMYAPMAVVAAQLPLAAVRAFTRSRIGAFMRSGDVVRAGRFAVAGWGALVALAVLLQGRSLAELWPQRDAALHGLGGPAAQAASTADAVGADAIYVASVDGTPRRFGAGSLTGLRYPWLKWFDPSRSLPFPPESATAVYVLSELHGQAVAGDLTPCLGSPDAAFQRVLTGTEVRQLCAPDLRPGPLPPITFDGLARVDALRVAAAGEAGQPLETHLLWQPLVAHPDPQQLSLQLVDPEAGDGTQWGNGTLELYPARQWESNEAVMSRVPLVTDATALPQSYQLTLGIAPMKANAPPATASWQGGRTDRVPVATVMLTPGTNRADQALPADMRALEGAPLAGGGLELIGSRPLPAETAIGAPLKIGLLWRAMQDAPEAVPMKLRLLRANGEVVQESVLPLLGGRVMPSALRAGNVVRDEQTLLIGSGVPTEALSLEVSVLNAHARLGSLKMTGRAHTFDSGAPVAAQATFGKAMELLDARPEPAQARSREKVTIKLRWRSAADMPQAYKVFVHVLDPAGQQVIAQRDAEPLDGRAPTTGWVVGELIDDDYPITLAANLRPGEYPIEVGVYDARSGDRLMLANGDNRFLLTSRLKVQ